jgi:hypothetical protein
MDEDMKLAIRESLSSLPLPSTPAPADPKADTDKSAEKADASGKKVVGLVSSTEASCRNAAGKFSTSKLLASAHLLTASLPVIGPGDHLL